jgi:two-component system response regulator NreC
MTTMTSEKIRLLIADDHTILRQGLRRIVEEEHDMEVVGEAATGTEAVALAKELHPDIVIMDISMPGQNGIESTRQISMQGDSRVLVLTMHLERQIIANAVTAGASGYLLKDSIDDELLTALRTINGGGSVFSPDVTKILANLGPAREESQRSLDLLTTREKEVFYLLAEGKSSAAIADALFVSPKTIHTHRQHIMDKLGLRTLGELIHYAIREGLINND